MKIGITFLSVSEEYEKDPLRALDEIASAGYEVMEVARHDRIGRDDLRRALDQRGLKAVSGHFSLTDFEGDMYEDTLKYANVLGIDTLVIPGCPGECFADYESSVKTARMLDKLAARVKERGFILLYHNHDREFSDVFNGKCVEDILFENTSLLGFELDIGWAFAGGCDTVPYINKLGPRLVCVHIKDVDATNMPVEVGTGIVNLKESLDAAAALGVKVGIVEQDVRRAYPGFESIRISRNNLRGFGY